MKKIILGIFFLTLPIFIYGLFGVVEAYAVSGNEVVISSFDILPGTNPKIVQSGQSVPFDFVFVVNGPELFNSCYYGASSNYTGQIRWSIYRDLAPAALDTEITGVTFNFSSFSGNSTLTVSNNVSFANATIYPSPGRYYGAVSCIIAGGADTIILQESTRIDVTINPSSTGGGVLSWACIAGDGKFACANDQTSCQSLSSCSGKLCQQIDKNLCGQPSSGYYNPPSVPGTNVPLTWNVTNPFKGNITNPQMLILEVVNWILNVAAALIVILIIYSGIRFMLAAGRPNEITRGKKILTWALIGFAVVLIGKGFIALIISVLQGNIPTLP